MNKTILVVEDDEDIVELLRLYLENEGFHIHTAKNGVEALSVLKMYTFDLAVIDIMMPIMNGYELVKEVRNFSNIPIIILSAKNLDSDKILGLNIGADDYITKPFNPLEIIARIKSNIRRFYQLKEEVFYDNSSIIKIRSVELDFEKIIVKRDEKVVSLTPMEFKILVFLMKNAGRVLTKTQIYESINGEYFENDDSTMMVHISNLREKIEQDPKKPTYIITVRGIGYKFEKE